MLSFLDLEQFILLVRDFGVLGHQDPLEFLLPDRLGFILVQVVVEGTVALDGLVLLLLEVEVQVACFISLGMLELFQLFLHLQQVVVVLLESADRIGQVIDSVVVFLAQRQEFSLE